MSESFLLYSSHFITTEELIEILRQAGGVVTLEGPRFGRVSHHRSHIWISPIDCDEGVVDEEDLKEVAQVNALLGAQCRSCISIKVSSTPGSQRLAVHFASTCGSQWPCVIDNLHGQFFSWEEIKRLHREDGGFTTYGL